jgi:hypothetical protein
VNELTYQRSIIAYHGCDETVVTNVLTLGHQLKPSENDYDWLGHGTYFWEYGPRRALEWAKASKKIKKPAILGAIINLGSCFDLLDTAYTRLLKELFPFYCEECEKRGVPIPQNLPAGGEASGDLLRRHLDCAVINWCLNLLERKDFHFHSVRGVFSEGDAAYAGSKIMEKSHIQIAVRDVNAIVGFFKPALDTWGDPAHLT